MDTFREYFQGDKLTRYTLGNKNPNRVGLNKKHLTTTTKEYKHKNPHISNLIRGGAQQIKLAGAPLMSLLNDYDLDFQDGAEKRVGNSAVICKMFVDEEGNKCGIIMVK